MKKKSISKFELDDFDDCGVSVKVTMVYYSYPAALRDLDEWEHTMRKNIVMKFGFPSGDNDTKKTYLMTHGGNLYEVVVCLPIESTKENDVSQNRLEIQDAADLVVRCLQSFYPQGIIFGFEYWKTVIFGSATSGELFNIKKMVYDLETVNLDSCK